MSVKNKANICQTCLSTDRQLVCTSTISSVLDEIKFKELEAKAICWECHRIIMKFYRFKIQAKNAQTVLYKKLQNLTTFSRLLNITNNSYDYELVYENDPLKNSTVPTIPDVKSESTIKQEMAEENNTTVDSTLDYDNSKNLKVFVDTIKTEKTKRSLLKTKKIALSKEIKEDQRSLKTKKIALSKEIKEDQRALKTKKMALSKEIKEDQRSLKTKKLTLSKEIKEDQTSLFKTKIALSKDIKEDRTQLKPKKITLSKEIKEDMLIKEKFKTVSLTEEEVSRRREEKRSHPNFKRVPFKCDMCVLGFTKMDNYELHFEKRHAKTLGGYTCKVCSIRFSKESLLNRHQNKHYFIYACTLCEYETSAWKAAVNHCIDKHALDEKDRIHCKQCSSVFRTPEELAAHTKSEHMLYCNDCGEKFKGQHTLRTHQVRIHAVKRDFICETCKRTFVTKSRLESHMIRHGQTVARRLTYCALCKVQFKNIQVYRNHVRNSVEHSQHRYQCPECKKKFASKEYWTKHYNFYHLKKSQYKCEACDKLFISKWRLKNHRQKHHGLSRSRDHGCGECAKRFYTLTTLRSHMLTHSDHRSYMCADCGDTFKQRAALYTHERRVHRGRGEVGIRGSGD